jgi:7-keto-8-aminopelargonate synthetase-like enzyme
MSAIQCFATRNDVVLADRNLHSSLWSGINMSHARVEKFSHNDPDSLLRALKLEPPEKAKLLVFEGVYSMEGHIAPLPDFLKIAKAHNMFTVMDDAHGLGVIGENGRGTTEHFDCLGRIDLICGSLSKAMATTGGYVAGDKELLEYMRSHSKQTIFSAAISPPQAACAEAALKLIRTEPEHLIRLRKNTDDYKAGLKELGVDTWDSQTAAVPLVIGDKVKAYRLWEELIRQGVFTTISLPPSVPPKKELLRTAISAAHTAEDIDQALERLAAALKKCS